MTPAPSSKPQKINNTNTWRTALLGEESQSLAIYLLSFFALIAYIVIGFKRIGETEFDDAYMFIRYARNYIDGHGFSWNPSDGPSYGSTSPLYLILVTTALAFSKASDAHVLTGLSFIGGGLTLVSLPFISLAILSRKHIKMRLNHGNSSVTRTGVLSWRRAIPFLAIPAVAFSQPFLYHSFTGMETTWSLFANSLFIVAVAKSERSQSIVNIVGVAFAGLLAIALRPDMAVYVLLIPFFFYLLNPPQRLKKSALYIVILVAGLALILLIWRSLFGSYLPLPLWSKSSGFYQGYLGVTKWNYVEYLIIFYRSGFPFVLLFVCSLPIRLRLFKKIFIIMVAMSLTFAYYSRVTQIMGYEARYYFPSLPFVAFIGFLGYSAGNVRIGDRKTKSPHHYAWVYLVALLSLFPLLNAHAFNRIVAWQNQRLLKESVPLEIDKKLYIVKAKAPLPRLGWWESVGAIEEFLNSSPTSGFMLAASEYGKLAATFPRIEILDLVGLHDKTLATRGFSSDYVLSRKPDIIWLPHDDYTGARKDIIQNPLFITNYAYYPGAFDYGIALRIDSPKYGTFARLLDAQLSSLYGIDNPSGYRAVYARNAN
jgi:hypothetical protein